MAKKDDASKGKDKEAKAKKDAKGKAKDRGEAAPYSSIATHPRARSSVRRAKGWFGLAGFAIAAIVSLSASVPLFQVGVRALVAGLIGYLLAWWASVQVWRHLIVAEQRAAAEEILRRRATETEPDQTDKAEAAAAR